MAATQSRSSNSLQSQSHSAASPASLSAVSAPSESFLSLNRDTVISDGKKLTATGQVVLQNTADSSAAFSVQDASGSNLLVADTQTKHVGIGTTPTGSATLQVAGDISSTGTLAANGGASSLSNAGLRINATTICTAQGCVPITRDALSLQGENAAFYTDASNLASGTLSDTRLSPDVALLNTTQVFSAANTFTNAGNSFTGNGSGLTNLNASSLASGTVPDVRLSANVTVAGNNFNGPSGLLQLDSSGNLPPLDGSALLNLDATHVTVGVLSDSRLSSNVTLQGNTFNGANELVQLTPSGDLPTLSGINLTNLNATNITAGTLSDLRLSPNVTLQGNTFNGASQLLQLTAQSFYPALNGSLITNLDAGNLASGTVSDSRLSSNVALLAATQTFTGTTTFANAVSAPALEPTGSALTVGTPTASLNLQGGLTSTLTVSGGGYTVTVGFSGIPAGNVVYSFDAATTPGSYTICTTVGNCASAGGGVTTLGGTTNKLAKFTGSQSLGDSSIVDTGTTITMQPSADSTNTFSVQNAAGTATVFAADSTDTRLAVGQATASYTLDVGGDINSATALRVGGNTVCTSSGCGASSGSGYYIQNGTGLQSNANFNIQSAGATSVVATVRGASGQSADLQDWQDGTGVTVASLLPNGTLNIAGSLQINGSQIASSNLADAANLAKLNGTGPQTFTGNNEFTGTVLLQNAADSTAAFQVQNAAGTSNLLIADTTDSRVGIGKLPGYTLDVAGDVNLSTGSAFRINGVAICGPSPTCAPSAGSTSYVQNSAALQTSANFNIQSVSASSVVGIVRGASGQTADLLRAQDGTGANVFTVGATGNVSITGTYQINGGSICTSSGCTAASGSGNYIQNGTGLQSNANFNIQSASTTSVVAVVRGASGQTADLQDWQDGTGVTVASLLPNGTLNISGSFEINGSQIASGNLADAANLAKLNGTGPQTFTGNNKFTGTVLLQNAADSTTAFQVQNAFGTSLLTVGTSNLVITLGPASSTPVILVLGTKNTAGDPTTCTPGSVYYNSVSNQAKACLAGNKWGSINGAYVTSLPASANDGDEVYYVADATNGVVWHLRYNASEPTYHWEYLGGNDLAAQDYSGTSITTTSNTYVTGGASALTITVPLTGDYAVTHGAHVLIQSYQGVTSYDTFSISGSATDTYALVVGGGNQGASYYEQSSGAMSYTMTLSAGTVLQEYVRNTNNGTSVYANYRWAHVHPIRVN